MISGHAHRIFLDVVHLEDGDPRLLRQRVLEAFEAALQIGRAEAGEHGDFALAAEEGDGLLGHDLSGSVIIHAVEGQAFRFRRVGVPGDHRNAGVDRAVDGLGQEVAVQRGNRDAVHALGDKRLENLLLLQLVRVRRRVPEDLDVAQLLGRALGADPCVVEDRQVERFRNDRKPQALTRAGCRMRARRRRRSCRHSARQCEVTFATATTPTLQVSRFICREASSQSASDVRRAREPEPPAKHAPRTTDRIFHVSTAIDP